MADFLLPHPMLPVTWVWGREPLISVIRNLLGFWKKAEAGWEYRMMDSGWLKRVWLPIHLRAHGYSVSIAMLLLEHLEAHPGYSVSLSSRPKSPTTDLHPCLVARELCNTHEAFNARLNVPAQMAWLSWDGEPEVRDEQFCSAHRTGPSFMQYTSRLLLRHDPRRPTFCTDIRKVSHDFNCFYHDTRWRSLLFLDSGCSGRCM